MSIIKKYFYYKADYTGDKKYVDVPVMYIKGVYTDTWVDNELIYILENEMLNILQIFSLFKRTQIIH